VDITSAVEPLPDRAAAATGKQSRQQQAASSKAKAAGKREVDAPAGDMLSDT
jgi:hypothetical protein